ncbi:hypothetical protein EU245_14605 [Lentibacillus lipolyticus]|nr:hypothetical protein EU245_14605 [Lentibacillus lipolyticus]
MIKEKIIEFLFNPKKYKVEKFVLMIMFWLVVLYLATAFRVSLTFIFALVLTFVLIMSIIKIMWYNKKNKIKTRVIDWVGIIFCLVVLIVALLLYYNEKRLENAVCEAIEEKVEDKNFTIDFIDKMDNKENYIVVVYTNGRNP